MRQITTILSEIVNNLDLEIIVKSVSTSGSNFILTVDKTWWLHKNVYFKLGATDYYKVVDFTLNQSLTITPVDHENTPTANTYILENPIFYHGKVKPTVAELRNIKDWYKQPPLIWLYEILRRSKPQDPITSIDSEGSISLFFLMTNNIQDWTTDDHYQQVILPLNELVEYFIEQLKVNPNLGTIGAIDTVNHAKFGEYSVESPTSTERQLLSLNQSGIEINPNIPILISC